MNKIFTKTANNNIIIWLLSYFSLPISIFLKSLRISPNLITLISVILVMISCYELIEGNFMSFALINFVAAILDICDGQVARMTNKINNTRLNIDHYCDILKICFIFFSFAIYFNNKNIWILIYILTFLYLIYNLLHLEINCINKKNSINNSKIYKLKNRPIFFEYFKINIFFCIYKIILPLLITFNLHSVLLFSIVIIDPKLIIFIFLYFIIIFLYRIFKLTIILFNTKYN
jgi:phosphatidylglycerophosphate synthase